MIALMQAEKHRFENHLMMTVGPKFLWAINSTRDDAYVRNELSKRVGAEAARQLLVEKYPAGNLDGPIKEKMEQERLAALAANNGEFIEADSKVSEGMLDGFVVQLERIYRERQSREEVAA